MSGLVLITGASSGIGQALALRFAQAGWRLALVARRLDVLRAWVQSQGLASHQVGLYGADVQNADALQAVAQRCLAEQGLPDVVIANAGISIGMDTAEREDLAVMADTLATNVMGLACTFHPFLRALWARRSGTLVGVASMAALRGLPGHGAYCASKAAAVAYLESLRGECRPYGVRVVTLLPGYVETPLTAGNPYPMPFLISAEAFADRAFKAILAGRRQAIIPWPMAIVAVLLKWMPGALFDAAFAGRGRKPRRKG